MDNSLADNTEEFYSRLWKTEGWNSVQPNADETSRAVVILMLLKKFVVSYFPREKKLQILDVGCGRGWLTKLLCGFGDAMGIDPTQSSVTSASELFPELKFVACTMQDLLMKNETGFDLIVASEVIEHVPDNAKETFVRDIYSLLAPNGFAIFTTPRGELWEKWKILGIAEQPVEQWLTEADFDLLTKKMGFKIIARDRTYLLDFNSDIITKLLSGRWLARFERLLPGKPFTNYAKHRSGLYQVLLVQKI